MREKRTDASLGNPNQASAGTKKPAEPEDRVLERTSKASRLTLSGRRPSFGVCSFKDLGFWGFGQTVRTKQQRGLNMLGSLRKRRTDAHLPTLWLKVGRCVLWPSLNPHCCRIVMMYFTNARQIELAHSCLVKTLLLCEARTFAASFWS